MFALGARLRPPQGFPFSTTRRYNNAYINTYNNESRLIEKSPCPGARRPPRVARPQQSSTTQAATAATAAETDDEPPSSAQSSYRHSGRGRAQDKIDGVEFNRRKVAARQRAAAEHGPLTTLDQVHADYTAAVAARVQAEVAEEAAETKLEAALQALESGQDTYAGHGGGPRRG